MNGMVWFVGYENSVYTSLCGLLIRRFHIFFALPYHWPGLNMFLVLIPAVNTRICVSLYLIWCDG